MTTEINKQNRSIITTKSKIHLNYYYNNINKYPTHNEKLNLCKKLNLTVKNVKIYFQNKRQRQLKKYNKLISTDDLTGEDLTGDDLTGEDLTGADLTGDDLTGADLTGDDLTGNDLIGNDLNSDYLMENENLIDNENLNDTNDDNVLKSILRKEFYFNAYLITYIFENFFKSPLSFQDNFDLAVKYLKSYPKINRDIAMNNIINLMFNTEIHSFILFNPSITFDAACYFAFINISNLHNNILNMVKDK